MKSQQTWIIKVEMSQPRALKEAPETGPPIFTDKDADRLHQRLRDGLSAESIRRLGNATVNENGVLIAFFETTEKPSPNEYQALYRLTASALAPFRRPAKFNCVATFPIEPSEIEWQV